MLEALIEAAKRAAPTAFSEGDDIPSFGPETNIDFPFLDYPTVRVDGGESWSRARGDVIVVGGSVEGPPTDGPERTSGIELLAWYRSFHVDPAGWGIYVRAWGVGHLARHLGGDPGSPSAAFEVLWVHEYAHFLADVAATVLEVNTGTPAYRPHLTLARRGSDPPHSRWCDTSEALATAAQLDAFAGSAYLPALRRWVRTLPRGYRSGRRYARTSGALARPAGRGSLLAHFAGADRDLSPFTAGSADLLFDAARHLVDDAEVPVYWIQDDLSVTVSGESLLRVAQIRETEGFRLTVSRLRKDAEWGKARKQIEHDLVGHGLRFKKLRGFTNRFSVRVGRAHRAVLRLEPGGVLVAEQFDNRGDVY